MLPKNEVSIYQEVTLFLTIQCQNRTVICVKLHGNIPPYVGEMRGLVENGSLTIEALWRLPLSGCRAQVMHVIL